MLRVAVSEDHESQAKKARRPRIISQQRYSMSKLDCGGDNDSGRTCLKWVWQGRVSFRPEQV